MVIYTVLVLCQVFITKLSPTYWLSLHWHIRILALYRVPLLYRRLNITNKSVPHHVTLIGKILTLSVFTTMECYNCAKTAFMWSVAVLPDQFSNLILRAHQPVELLHTVYSDRLWTEWKYKCKCTVTATVRCSYNYTDIAISQLCSSTMWLPIRNSMPDFNQWNLNIRTQNKNEQGKKFYFI